MPVESTGKPEQSYWYYDRIYKNPYDTTRFDEVYNAVMGFLSQREKPLIFECGSGTGALAERILKAGYSYRGFDFSRVALEKSPLSVKLWVHQANAYNKRTWQMFGYDTVIAVEVFEHLRDLKVLAHIPAGTRVIFSVPNFDSHSHVRVYPTLHDIVMYYIDVLKIEGAKHVQTTPTKHITVCDAVKL